MPPPPPPGFALPDWTGPLELDAQLAATPDDIMVRGVLIEGLRRRAITMGVDLGLDRFIPFKGYPIRAQLEILVQASERLNPDRPREGLRWIGQLAMPSVLETMLGKVMLGVLGKNPRSVFERAQHAFKSFGAKTTIKLHSQSDDHVHMHYIDAYAFPRWYHVGFIEGTVSALHHTPSVWTKIHSLTEVEYWCTWVPDAPLDEGPAPA